MKLLTKLMLACAAAVTTLQAQAQTITFNFDNAAAHSGLPIDVTANGLTAHLSGSGYGFSIQQAGVLGFTPLGFSGNCIYPDSVYPADLTISFPVDISDFSIMYSPEEYGCDSSATMRVTAYEDGVLVGSKTTVAPNPGTWPTGTLKFNNGKAFDTVVIHYDKPPVTGGDWGPVFMADNMKVTVSQIPDATDDVYNFPVNTSQTIPASAGVMANDEAVTGATAVLVSPPTHGVLSLATNGSFIYTPGVNFVGTDTFTYKDTLPTAVSNTATVKLNVLPTITSLALSPNSALSGSTVKGTVTISIAAPSSGAVVNLSSNMSSAPVASTLKIAGGKTSGTFLITTGAVATATSGQITASLAGSVATSPITVYPVSNLTGISALPTSFPGGLKSKMTITLDKPVPVGSETIILASGNPAVTVPATVKVAAGASSATFVVSSIPVDAITTAAVSASFNGVKLTQTLTVTLPPLTSLKVAPLSVVGGTASTGTVTLQAPAGPSGVVIQLGSSISAASVPATVTVPAGAKTATFTITTTAVMATTASKISATLNGVIKSATLTITH